MWKNTNFQIINNAIDAERFKFNKKNRKEIREKYNIKDDEILLGNIGRLCEQKNQGFLIDVLRKLDGKYKLMLIGDGNKKKEIEEKLSEYSLEKRVIFIKNTT
jgi:glycosyltransferase involved in cell wall biosynthesis